MTQAPEAPLPCVQNFQVHKLLGKGSYGKVYKVQREIDAQFYALKECDLGTMTHTERMNAVSEVRLLVSMNHPSVIRYHEAFLSGNKLCTVMEYAPFGDLKYYIDKGNRLSTPFPEEAVWRLFLQLCQGLSAIHAAKIIHRDIKPANIFLCKNDVLKIGDLGVAKALERLDFAKTQIGTPVYMAPEVWTGKQYSYSSDLWSLGCVLYEMMTFRLPVEARSLAELRSKVSRGKYTPLSPSSGIYSSELISMCHALLTVDPNRRPTLDMILQSPAASKWLGCLPSQAAPLPRRWSECGTGGGQGAGGLDRSQSQQLIKAIVMPRDIRNLPKLLLPPPSYEPLPPLPPASHSRKATAPDGDQATAAAAAAVAYGRLPAHSSSEDGRAGGGSGGGGGGGALQPTPPRGCSNSAGGLSPSTLAAALAPVRCLSPRVSDSGLPPQQPRRDSRAAAAGQLNNVAAGARASGGNGGGLLRKSSSIGGGLPQLAPMPMPPVTRAAN